MTKDYYEWCKRKAQEISKHNSEDAPSPHYPPHMYCMKIQNALW